jgi:hypothetical protein
VILTNTESVPGKEIVQFFGVVSGSTVRAKHIGRDLMAGLKNIVGGELKGYTELLHEARGPRSERSGERALLHQLGRPGRRRALRLRHRGGCEVEAWTRASSTSVA